MPLTRITTFVELLMITVGLKTSHTGEGELCGLKKHTFEKL